MKHVLLKVFLVLLLGFISACNQTNSIESQSDPDTKPKDIKSVSEIEEDDGLEGLQKNIASFLQTTDVNPEKPQDIKEIITLEDDLTSFQNSVIDIIRKKGVEQ
jgi:hypothetical protein